MGVGGNLKVNEEKALKALEEVLCEKFGLKTRILHELFFL